MQDPALILQDSAPDLLQPHARAAQQQILHDADRRQQLLTQTAPPGLGLGLGLDGAAPHARAIAAHPATVAVGRADRASLLRIGRRMSSLAPSPSAQAPAVAAAAPASVASSAHARLATAPTTMSLAAATAAKQQQQLLLHQQQQQQQQHQVQSPPMPLQAEGPPEPEAPRRRAHSVSEEQAQDASCQRSPTAAAAVTDPAGSRRPHVAGPAHFSTLRPRRAKHRAATILNPRGGRRRRRGAEGDEGESDEEEDEQWWDEDGPSCARELLQGATMREYSDHLVTDLGPHDPPGVFTCQWLVAAPRALCFLFHGLHEHTGRFERLVDEMTTRGVSVYGLDLPGHGKSGGERGYFHSAEGVVRMLAAHVRRCAARHDGVPTFLVGHGLGATFAALALPRLSGVALAGAVLASLYSVSGDVSRLSRGLLRVACAISPHGQGYAPPEASTAAPAAEDTRGDALCRVGPVRARVASEVVQAGRAIWALPPDALAVPLLLLQGEHDPAAEPGARTLFERSTARDKALRLCRGLRRYLIVGDDPATDDVVRDVCAWVLERAAAPVVPGPARPRSPLPSAAAAASAATSGAGTSGHPAPDASSSSSSSSASRSLHQRRKPLMSALAAPQSAPPGSLPALLPSPPSSPQQPPQPS